MARRRSGAGDHGAVLAPMPPAPPVASITAAQLMVDAGCTDQEIADSLDLTLAEVSRLPEVSAARIGPAHVARLERAAYDAGLPGITWHERAVAGEVRRLEAYRPPDMKANSMVLAAHLPERYGAQEPVKPAPAAISVTVQFVSARGEVLSALESDPLPGVGGYLENGTGGGGE